MVNSHAAHSKTIETIAQEFGTNIKVGLSSKEASARLRTYGSNILPEKKPPSPFSIFFQQFLNPFMFVLVIAALVSLLIEAYKDALVIFFAAGINVMVGFFQEWKAEHALGALKLRQDPQSHVRRNKTIIALKSSLLVPGDIVLLEAGTKVPADIRLFSTNHLYIEEAMLTGEAVAINKTTDPLPEATITANQRNIAHAGTYILQGRGEGIVIATGKQTTFGSLSQLIMETKKEHTPLQKQIAHLSWALGRFVLPIIGLMFCIGWFKGIALTTMITFSIALAVASIPEEMLLGITTLLAIGMQRMLKQKSLVRHLIAAETLGSVSVICTDKTGTLTQGQMKVSIIQTTEHTLLMNGKPINQQLITMTKPLVIAGILNNDAHILSREENRIGTPTETALLECAQELHYDIDTTRAHFPRLQETPFSSHLKYMATLHQENDHSWLIIKGAPEKVLPLCALESTTQKKIMTQVEDLTKDGLRILAFAEKRGESITIEQDLHSLTYLGIIGFQDPLRPHAAETIQQLQTAGIRIVIVTGDHAETTIHLARQIGLYNDHTHLLTGTDLLQFNEVELDQRITTTDIFARVSPEDKIRIVQAWQRQGKIVAMTGDGINDAPALKAANIGVALGAGSGVAHEIADMILLDNNLATIAKAVEEGRIIFDNIRKTIVYVLAHTFSDIILLMLALLWNLPMPISAVQILWIHLITDGFPNIALTLEPGEKGIMQEPPRSPKESILTLEMKSIIFIVSVITDIGLFTLYSSLLRSNAPFANVQTIMFSTLAISSLSYIFSVRALRSSILTTNPFKNRWLIFAVLFGSIMQIAAVYIPTLQQILSTVPLPASSWIIIFGLACIKLICIELTKGIFFIVKRS